ncbi:DUF58 domain-containing protein [Shimia sp.]|uniref:DUF58 domain-containing protein n=1 Tax=Shimia sp. TaxID=1954381 RepID=UPI003B8BA49A
MKHRAAISRMGLAPKRSSQAPTDTRVHITLSHLRGFAPAARAISLLSRHPATSVLQGRHRSRIRGRGLDFEELRGYLPGDDVRSIDWKVTARARTPYVRVYTEERDRPTLIVVDQRMSMFFGTVRNTKSVTAAECAAIAAHRVVAQGDRIGGIVFGDQEIEELRPKRGQAALTRFLSAVVAGNQRLSATAPTVAPMALNDVLNAVARLARRDHLVIVLSDFDAADEATQFHLGAIAQHNDVVLGVVSDPTSTQLPEQGTVVGTDGNKQAELDIGEAMVRTGVLSVATHRIEQIKSWQTRMRLSVLPLSTAEETLPQVVRLLGGAQR